MKLHGHRPGLPGNVMSFYVVSLDPAYTAGHVPVTAGGSLSMGFVQESVKGEA